MENIYYRTEKNSDLYEGIIYNETEMEFLKKEDPKLFRRCSFKKVIVNDKDIYYFFGARFSDIYTYIN